MGKKHKKLTRAMKIEQAREQAKLDAIWRKQPWYPVPGTTMEEAVHIVVCWKNDIERDADDPKYADDVARWRNNLTTVPTVVMEQANAKIAVEKARWERHSLIFGRDDYDDHDWGSDDYDEPPLYPAGKVVGMTDEELEAEIERVCDRQGALGDDDPINERAVAECETRYQILTNERHRREQAKAA